MKQSMNSYLTSFIKQNTTEPLQIPGTILAEKNLLVIHMQETRGYKPGLQGGRV